MSNRNGQSYALVVLAPVAEGRIAALRSHLERLPTQAASPFAHVPGTHMARLVVIDRLPSERAPEPPDEPATGYLLLASDFDGRLDAYLDLLCARIGAELDAILGHCDGYPGSADRRAFAAYVRRHQVGVGFSIVGYPEATVEDVHAALDLRARLAGFAAAAQEMDAATLHRAWRELAA